MKDLRQRFRIEQPPGEIQGQASPATSGPSPPAAVPRDLRPLRPSPTARLTPKLPDPPIFKGDRSKFEDWKLKILDKLTLNNDHYPSESFKIAYVLTRLGGKAVQHTIFRRRSNTNKPYLTVQDLLDHMRDVYETPIYLIEDERFWHGQTMKQGNRSFAEFYAEFIQIFGHRGYSDEHLFFQLQWRLNPQLFEHFLNSAGINEPSFSKQKDLLLQMDIGHRLIEKNSAICEKQRKSETFAKQYAKAKAEAEANSRRSGKYVILRRSSDSGYESDEDLEAFRR